LPSMMCSCKVFVYRDAAENKTVVMVFSAVNESSYRVLVVDGDNARVVYVPSSMPCRVFEQLYNLSCSDAVISKCWGMPIHIADFRLRGVYDCTGKSIKIYAD